MAEVNPFSRIGASNDPSLTLRTVNADNVANQLQAGLAKLNSERAGALQLADTNNVAALQRTGLPLGLDTTKDFGPGLSSIGNDISSGRQAVTRSNSANALAQLMDSVGILVNPPIDATVSEAFDPSQPILRVTPGNIQKSNVAGKAAAEATVKKSQQNTTEGVGIPGGPDIGFQKRKSVTGSETTDKQKGTSRAVKASNIALDEVRAARMKDFFTKQHPNVTVSDPYTAPDGSVRIVIDGVENIVE